MFEVAPPQGDEFSKVSEGSRESYFKFEEMYCNFFWMYWSKKG